MTTTTKKTVPAWLQITPSQAIVKLSTPVTLNSVSCDTITLRAPTIGDLRAAEKQHKDDQGAQELQMFATLAQCGVSDLDGLSLRDYHRVQDAYFRLSDPADE